MNPKLRLTSRSGVEFVARLVYPGEHYGADGRNVNQQYRTLVEFLLLRGVGEHSVAAYGVDHMDEISDGWEPGGVGNLSLSQREIDRLREWLKDPSGVDDPIVVLAGDDEELDKVGVALTRLRLEARHESDGVQALVRMKRLPPTLAVIGQHVGRLDPLELVKRLHGTAETRDVPVIVVGGDAAAARAAGADLHVPSPPDYQELVNKAAELLEFV